MAYGIADVMNLRRLTEASDIGERQRRIERQKSEALIGFCETTSCRRQALLGYFGERDHSPCGNCDNCRNPVASWDGTIAAQKALSAVYRTGQRFGAHHLIDVLVGNATARIRDLGHDRLKTFGVGTELDGRQWLSVIRQLLAQGLLLPDPDGHGGLALAPSAGDVLRGARTVGFRQEVPRERVNRRKPGKRALPDLALDSATQILWTALRAWRLDEARRQELPPYVIFHDATLIEVARRRPHTLEALADIPIIHERLGRRQRHPADQMVRLERQWPRLLNQSLAGPRTHADQVCHPSGGHTGHSFDHSSSWSKSRPQARLRTTRNS